MKTFLLLALLIPSVSFADSIKVKVQGMVCSMCAQGIKKKFSAVKEVSNVDVNLEDKLVSIETKGKSDLSDEVITKYIQEAGYNVAKIDRK